MRTLFASFFTLLFSLAFMNVWAQVSIKPEKIYADNVNSTVTLKTDNGSLGSGFFVGSNIIATNYHVIEGANKVKCFAYQSNSPYEIEGYVAIDVENDLVLLKVKTLEKKSLSITSKPIEIGQRVYVIGTPLELPATFSDGIISNKINENNKRLLQMTAAISPGSSGGPVFNEYGEIIGVSVAQINRGQNLNFAVPASKLIELLNFRKEKPIALSGDGGNEGNSTTRTTNTVSGNGNNPDALYKQALKELEDENYKDALRHLYEIAEMDDTYKNVHSLIGIIRFFEDETEEAYKHFNKELKSYPNDYKSLSFRANCHYKLKRYKEAREDAKEVVEESSEDIWRAYWILGLTEWRTFDYKDALDHLKKAENLSKKEEVQNDRIALEKETEDILALSNKVKQVSKKFDSGDYSSIKVYKVTFKITDVSYKGMLVLDEEQEGFLMMKYRKNVIFELAKRKKSDLNNYAARVKCYTPIDVTGADGQMLKNYAPDCFYVKEEGEVTNIDRDGNKADVRIEKLTDEWEMKTLKKEIESAD